MKATYNIYGLHLEIVANNSILFHTLSDELNMFRTRNNGHASKTVRLTLNTLPNALSKNGRAAKHEKISENKFLSQHVSVTNYAKNLISVTADYAKRRIDVFSVLDPILFPDPVYHRGLTQPISLWLKKMGRFFIHAGCVASDDKGILIIGDSGAGKTTLSLSAVRGGFQFLSDEQPVLAMQKGQVRAFAFPRQIRVDRKSAKRFPELLRLIKPSTPERFIFPIEKIWPSCVTASCGPKFLLFPRFNAKTKILLKKPLSPSAALAKLLKDEYFILYRMNKWKRIAQQHLELFERLVHQATAFEVLYSDQNISDMPAFFQSLTRPEIIKHKTNH